MTLFLRSKQTHLYYAGLSRWVEKPREAVGFQTVEDALLLRHEQRLQQMELVIQHGAPSFKEVVLPIGAKTWGTSRWDGF
ncbi:MAG: hypothetical protein C5B50_25600 [Verrucomicrobia bacterium]|nr:MAG: hypothetical protein C5B50_25600 [Verrucomicrobiota bacterium]